MKKKKKYRRRQLVHVHCKSQDKGKRRIIKGIADKGPPPPPPPLFLGSLLIATSLGGSGINSSCHHPNRVDKYYIESGAVLWFHSRIAAERYLEEVRKSKSTTNAKEGNQLTKTNISGEDLPLGVITKQQKDVKKIKVASKALKPGNHYVMNNSISRTNYVSSKEVRALTLHCGSTPAEVKWVLGGPGGNVWNPFVGESIVPESVKQEWSEMYVFSVYEKY